MPIYLGSQPVTLKLGTQDVAGFLGDAAVTVVARTLYFTGAVDSDWSELGNWFDDAEGTVAASSLPTAADSVIATASILSNSGSEPTVYAFEIDGDNININIALTVTTLAVWKTNAWGGFGMVLTGNAEWNGTNGNAGIVNGNAVFNDTTFNNGTVTGNATFNDSSQNYGTVTGDATFNNSSSNGGTVTGNATFNDSSVNYGTVTGTATFTGSACNDGGTAGTFVPDPPPSC